ncbi:MAG: 50S ribosomal protein L11 methyltransferase [Clostridiales Family XIII bacterium]|jgi:ribosomal protein L11 methyltransferase|nr:50S ribosomal protein L11 methyltransferase [Clostridiales Family XIII bacterium]
MDFIETKIYTTTSGVEPVTALLMRYGIVEVSIEDRNDLKAIVDAKDWLGWDYLDEGLADKTGGSEAVLTFYTRNDDEGRELLSEFKIGLMMLKASEQYGDFGRDADLGRLYAESAPLLDEWKETWKERFKSFRATERIIVRPAWEVTAGEPSGVALEAPPGTSGDIVPIASGCDILLTIDPGMAFGTGSHETTAMCLAELERVVRPGLSVLDIGTGSGILAIAAVLLGAGRVMAVEYDEDAAVSASSNFKLNGVAGRVDLVKGDIREIALDLGIYDIVTANLTSGLIRRIAETLPSLLLSGGRLIVSGLLTDEELDMRKALMDAGFISISSEHRGEWLKLCADFS